MSWPGYLALHESGELARRVDAALGTLAPCRVCPRDCGIDRLADERKVCHVGRHARVSSAFAHFGEEDCLRGWNGSGTIFFSWCNLKCVFCQNWETSNEGHGHEVDAEQLAALMLDLQRQGCHNINFVTPEHVVPQVLEALPIAIEAGLNVPLIYNTSGYDSLHSLALLDGVVDIYMPDFKYWSAERSHAVLKARDYPEHTRAALREMHRQVGPLQMDAQGLARRGVLVRHLVMPDGLDETRAIFTWLAEALGPETYVNVMDQYRPDGLVARRPDRWPELSRRTTRREHREALAVAHELGLRVDRR
ncbi:MAG: radical SAM protein [Planctomycetota bacterium]|nr:radical SAM protein [Planctomycetota bacterium]